MEVHIARVMAWLSSYWAATPGVELYDNATVRLDIDNEPQPDAFLESSRQPVERSHISTDDFIEGPPELIVEIAASSASYDLHDKLQRIAAMACKSTSSGACMTNKLIGSAWSMKNMFCKRLTIQV